ncbi:type II toxin-antitoxin system RelE/ParE family toxin [Rhodococcus sp. WS4]|nr:type II toxin-antitoxin system RelE/ParE family toxin [Rhodococcus sp. WS4]
MIESFGDKETERVFHRQFSKKLPQDIQRIARRRLLLIDAATDVNDLRVPPGNRLEKLSGDRSGQYSVRINDQYRICFNWRATAAYDVEITDYH